MEEAVFSHCREINCLLDNGNEEEARNKLIKLLDDHERMQLPYSPLVNHLIRKTGLYPYIQEDTAGWEDKFVYEAFKVDTGNREKQTLHREQSFLLKELLSGKNIAVSAPTSFGKSFVIDAFIAIKKPRNVVIIVPTIALADETRRRIYKKFSSEYRIITTGDVELGDKNIFIFPQERVFGYVDKIEKIDILIIDEFYKASSKYEDRSVSLLNAILKIKDKAVQKYYLAPNISNISPNLFTHDMLFVRELDFNTVFLNKHDEYVRIGRDESKKSERLCEILKPRSSKSLIYAASFPQIEKVTNAINERLDSKENNRLSSFADWLSLNYDTNWKLTSLIKKGIGIHNGRLHRALSQIQVRLFEEKDGLDAIVSTSSIIEGVNTSAENVIVWRNRRSGSNAKLDVFTYKNIIGRAGRMFKHFVGQIYLLEPPPTESEVQLDIDLSEEVLCNVCESDYDKISQDQVASINSSKQAMSKLLGEENYRSLINENLRCGSYAFIRKIAVGIKEDCTKWKCLAYLNSENPEDWKGVLYTVLSAVKGELVDYDFTKSQYDENRSFVEFVVCLSENWTRTIPDMLAVLEDYDIGIDKFFKFERAVTYKFAEILKDISNIHNKITDDNINISSFLAKASHAFLPRNVYELEEYGLPRMVSKKIQNAGIINLEDNEIPLHEVLLQLKKIGKERLKQQLEGSLHPFEHYILDYFYDGIAC